MICILHAFCKCCIMFSAIGVQMSVVPTLLGDLFGVQHFGRNWGLTMFFNAISASILQVNS